MRQLRLRSGQTRRAWVVVLEAGPGGVGSSAGSPVAVRRRVAISGPMRTTTAEPARPHHRHRPGSGRRGRGPLRSAPRTGGTWKAMRWLRARGPAPRLTRAAGCGGRRRWTAPHPGGDRARPAVPGWGPRRRAGSRPLTRRTAMPKPRPAQRIEERRVCTVAPDRPRGRGGHLQPAAHRSRARGATAASRSRSSPHSSMRNRPVRGDEEGNRIVALEVEVEASRVRLQDSHAASIRGRSRDLDLVEAVERADDRGRSSGPGARRGSSSARPASAVRPRVGSSST